MRKLLLIAAISSTFVITGCATLGNSTPPLTIDQLVERAKKGESNESLLASVRASGERFSLTGSEFAKLKERGLPEPLLDELQRRELQAARDEEWMKNQFYWNGLWRPWPYVGYRYLYVPHPIPRTKL